MEAIERYSGIFQGDEIRAKRRFADFPSDDAIPPNEVLLFSDAQLQQGFAPTHGSGTGEAIPALFDQSAKIDWSPVCLCATPLQISSDQPVVFFLSGRRRLRSGF